MLATVMIDPDASLTEGQAAEIVGVSIRTLQAWRVRGGGPEYRKIGRAVRYSRRDLIAFMDAKKVSSTSEASARQ